MLHHVRYVLCGSAVRSCRTALWCKSGSPWGESCGMCWYFTGICGVYLGTLIFKDIVGVWNSLGLGFFTSHCRDDVMGYNISSCRVEFRILWVHLWHHQRNFFQFISTNMSRSWTIGAGDMNNLNSYPQRTYNQEGQIILYIANVSEKPCNRDECNRCITRQLDMNSKDGFKERS